jgi:hypothetical protein
MLSNQTGNLLRRDVCVPDPWTAGRLDIYKRLGITESIHANPGDDARSARALKLRVKPFDNGVAAGCFTRDAAANSNPRSVIQLLPSTVSAI